MNLSQVFPSGLSTHDVTLLGYGLHLNLRDDHLQSYILACAIRHLRTWTKQWYTRIIHDPGRYLKGLTWLRSRLPKSTNCFRPGAEVTAWP
jgi:hypothetical protein